MRVFAGAVLSDEPGGLKRRIAGMYTLLLAFNGGAWLWALVAFHRYPAVLGTAFLAYCLGLRHAVRQPTRRCYAAVSSPAQTCRGRSLKR